MDSIRGNLFWQGVDDNCKYHMMKWENLCIPKEFGGLGIMDTRMMNESSIVKWGWRMLEAKTDDICFNLLKRKYLGRSSLQINKWDGSQFWKGVHRTKENLKWGCRAKVGNGNNVRFWEEVWVGEVPLKLELPSLYHLCGDKECLVSDYWEGDGWHITFRRALGDEDMKEWERLIVLLDDFRLNEEPDHFEWVLDKLGRYTTRSMYRRLTFRGVSNRRMSKLWKSKLPNKIKIFAWLAVQDRLQSGVNLKNRNWEGSEKCILCGVDETSDHIFFNCAISRLVWFCFKEALGWDRCPSSMQDVFDNGVKLGDRNCHVKLFIFFVILWGLWNIRNKMGIEKKFPNSSIDVFHKIFLMLQRWRILLKGQDIWFLDGKMEKMKAWLKAFWSRTAKMDVEGVL